MTDLSLEINELRSELRVIRHTHGSDMSSVSSDTDTVSDTELARNVIECVNAHKYLRALLRAKQYK